MTRHSSYGFDLDVEADRLAVGDDECRALIRESLDQAILYGRRTLIDAMVQWLEIKATWSAVPFNPYNFGADVDHSSLLARLLRGEEPYPYPPPCAFSYPWTDLIDAGEAGVTVAYVTLWDAQDDRLFFINQSAWRLVEILDEGIDYLVEWRDRKDDKSYWGTYRITKIDENNWHLRPYTVEL